MAFIFSTSVLDSKWAGHSFRVKPEDLNEDYIDKRRYYTTSQRSFVDTSWGGHFAVNPYPQFTRNCDVNHKSKYTGNNVPSPLGEHGGVGRWWSETLDDYQQEIHIRAGVVKFNSMFTFFTNFYNVGASILSRRGRATSVFYSLGKAAGFVGTLPLQPFILGAEAINFFMSTPRTKFYYLQPAMHMYWSAVASMMNTYMVNVGLTNYFQPGDNLDTKGEIFDPVVTSYEAGADWKQQVRQFSDAYGDRITTRGGGIDVFAISTRAQRLGQIYRKNINGLLERKLGFNAGPEERRKALLSLADGDIDTVLGNLPGPSGINQTIATEVGESGNEEKSFLQLFIDYQFKKTSKHGPKHALGEYVPGESDENEEEYPNSIEETTDEFRALFIEVPKGEEGEEGEGVEIASTESSEGWFDFFKKMGTAVRGNMEMGAEFVTFRISNTGTQSESFSNTSGESGIMDTINSNSSKARSARFNFAGGNLGGVTGAIVNAAEEIVAGALDSIQLGGLMALGGSAFIDIQKVYQNSSADMMTTSITIPLRAWSADPWTVAKDVAYPLFCILALAMPKSTGSRSYDEPFLLETFLRGRSQIREGRVRSVSITRGTGDVGWTRDGHALGIDVTLEIEDMSGVVGVPINPSTSRVIARATGAISGALGGSVDGAAGFVDNVTAAFSKSTYSEDNKFGDYMNVLGAVDMHRQINTFRKWKVRLAHTRASMDQWRSPHALAGAFSDTLPGQILQAIGRPTDRN